MKASVAGESLLMAALNACRSRLKAFIRGRTAVRDDADDILQEVTYQLMQVEQPVENVAAWLFRAARNEMTDRARKKRELPLSRFFTDDEGDVAEDELAETLFGVPQTPEEEYLKTLLWEELEQALAELPSAQREVFEKTELYGYSYKELAEESGASQQALLSRKHKAVLYLRSRLRSVYEALTEEP
ncbi:RNA polymerase sigma factor [Kosakonia radicincitans]|uniref:RNA polymerase sigma factor, sigma-70 family n=1 Tax=Kosakonia radicincitans TaxID=283686 RepID=A0AAX2EP59_9ENTR|nr:MULTISPECIES: RNA polymerase sigma factor [Kosakonia]APG21007.1 RNA polymerase subunit sigma-24 [Kosakonia radicincitans]KDE38233.1 RNA polymerase subunit sigma-24 [Kosakonia radicincitans UMEnt01/12]MDD7998479.1 RNA polymerase sigma factor [Kosakonia radicincitans]NCF07663.1 RNA polymerase sigma factor [Kosakonia sp. MH5]PTA93930.1 RNA polymerase sigma factor [Kosakonia sp. H7A]